jgi:cellulose synthase/poly-beta-1,6-N-acetylglucosamine synthase-like glycosyltransferase
VLTKSHDTRTVGDGVGFYWRYEKLIRHSESQLHSSVGATGAIYALRRELFTPIAPSTILDDVLIPMNIVRQGYRVLFESEARAYDLLPATTREEFTRKVRTIGGNFQLFARERWLLNPLQNPIWFQTLSHKAARLLTPLLHAIAFGANVMLVADPGFAVLLALQVGFYVVAWGGFALRNTRRPIPFILVPYAICLLGWATVVAFIRYVSGRQQVTWDHASA